MLKSKGAKASFAKKHCTGSSIARRTSQQRLWEIKAPLVIMYFSNRIHLFSNISNYFSISSKCAFPSFAFPSNANRRFLVICDALHMYSALLPHRFTYQRLLRLARGLEIAASLFSTAMISLLARLVAARESQTKGEWQTQTSTSVPEPNVLFRGFGCCNFFL